MKTLVLNLALLCLVMTGYAQSSLRGVLMDPDNQPVLYANIALHQSVDSTLIKVEVSDEEGRFNFEGLPAGAYFLKVSYVGLSDLIREISLSQDEQLDLGLLSFTKGGIDLQTATVTAARVMVEVKPDRTVFNVDGTINSAGDNALGLLRKAPGVLVDNNDNISVLSRSGVLVYIDGKRLPLQGEDLSNYLHNIPAEQIDKFDIITNPSAKYEAEGNAGIIDIRLKKNKNEGANGTLSSNLTQGQYTRGNLNLSGNYRNSAFNIFANGGYSAGENFNTIDFLSFQNGLQLTETNRFVRDWQTYDYRIGADFFASKHSTLGFIVSARNNDGSGTSKNRIEIAQEATGNLTDSILVADGNSDFFQKQSTFNLNYRYEKEQTSMNIDADYGRYRNGNVRYQPNRYYDPTGEYVLTEVINSFDTPRDIDIYTFKVDFESKLGKGKFGTGTKLSQVGTDNTFLFYDETNGVPVLNNKSSNQFDYNEMVYAGYINYNTPLGDKWNFTAGLRAEYTDAVGDLQAFDPELQEPPVQFNYLSWFPSAGLTYQVSQQNTLSLNYGRRINRPDYNVLNPFNNQLSELSYEKGNPFLQPEIVNNMELGYTLKYRYNFKIGYSKTIDQITRLIGPSDTDERANFITWENLATQQIFSANISAPIQVTKKWNAYFNISASYLNNQADYGGNAIVDVQAGTYSIFQQHTIDLPKGFKGEISGWYSGPGVWGGVFRYDPSWSLNLGIQKKFLNDQLNVKLSAQDLFYESGWEGYSKFNGLYSIGNGNWDSRQIGLSLSYNFGNQNIKSRRHSTGLEDESKRVGNQ
ncbi:MAG: TonB-dependent receptor [Saprospiraceae bacterium]|nr:TonB-dependent receptor [Saprospiraceae bacterium]